MCNGSGCGGPSAEAIQEMNTKGIYMPRQISGQVEEDWTTINKKGTETVTLSDLKKICTASVTGLGKLGGKDKFVAKKFTQVTNELYKGQKEFT